MAEPPIDIDPEFEPLSRPRSCTWPLRRPDLSIKDGDPGQRGSEGAVEGVDVTEGTEEGIDGASPSGASLPCAGAGLKKGSSRRNAWGNLSYADLITSAIESAPEHRLTLAQIYEWMVRSVPYFRDKGDSNSSAGWKNSIRHNLSLHSKFIRVQNEGTGKSSWWVLNPDGGKGGKSPRRRAVSMETNGSKLARSRARAVAKKKAALGGPAPTGNCGGASAGPPGEPGTRSPGGWGGGPAGAPGPDDFDAWSDFRSRAGSAASAGSLGGGGGRLSPIPASQEPEELREDGGPGGAGTPSFVPTLDSMSLHERLQRRFDDELSEELMDELLESLSVDMPPSDHGASTDGGSLRLLTDAHVAPPAPTRDLMAASQDVMMQHRQQHRHAMAATPQELASPQPGYAQQQLHAARFLAAHRRLGPAPTAVPLAQIAMSAPAPHGCVYSPSPPGTQPPPPLARPHVMTTQPDAAHSAHSFGLMQRSASYTFGFDGAAFLPGDPTWCGGGGPGSLQHQQQHHALFTQSPPADAGALDGRRLQALSATRPCLGPGYGPACARQDHHNCTQLALPPYHGPHDHHRHHQQQHRHMTALTRGPVFGKPPFQLPGGGGGVDFANPTRTIRYRPAFPSAFSEAAGPRGPATGPPQRGRLPCGPADRGPSAGLLPPLGEQPCGGAQPRLPSDLDPDMFGGGLECDLDSMIRHELTEGGGLLDVDLDTYVQAAASASRGVAGGAHRWVPG
ncbi:uncharacterized protein LOC144735753 [Lampetra planeri]